MTDPDRLPEAADSSTGTQRWAEILLLLDQALALPDAERQAWLAALPQETGKRLNQLLASRAAIEGAQFLAASAQLPTARTEAGLQPGQMVGPYRLLQPIGAGGMAWVWLAERADDGLKRRVALKLPRAGWAPGLAERMARERDILARLEHPHIARLYEAGFDDQGRPWLALEYVAGTPIDRHCRAQGLDMNARLGLIAQVAAALGHAHAQQVIHRDLKPSNIFVTAESQVRLLDFGIAKLMLAGQTEPTGLTQASGRALTPDYASPEQVLARPLGPASDVYSLGVVAYELLVGKRPYRLQRGTAAELEEAVTQAEIPLPSRMAPAGARRALRGDADAVLMKALQRDPARRYPDMASFALDLQRLTRHEPVSAQPDAWHYRARKWIRRHPLETSIAVALAVAVPAGAAAQVAVMLALGAGAIGTLWQARRAREEAAGARRQAARAEQVKRAALALFEDADSGAGAGAQTKAVDLLRAAAARMAEDEQLDALLRAELQLSVAFSLTGLGCTSDALPLAEQALTVARAHDAAGPLLIDALTITGEALRNAGRQAEALPLLREALAVAQALGDVPREVRAGQRLCAVLIDAGQRDEAVELIERAFERAMTPDSGVAGLHKTYLATARVNALRSAGRPLLRAAREAQSIVEQHFRGRLAEPVLVARLVLGAADVDEGDAQAGLARMVGLEADAKTLFGPSHPLLAAFLSWTADAQLDLGDPVGSLETSAKTLAMCQALQGDNGYDVALACRRTALAHLMLRRPASALPWLERAQPIVEAQYGQTHATWRDITALIALALASLGDHAGADAALQRLAMHGERPVRPALEQLRLWQCDVQAGRALPSPVGAADVWTSWSEAFSQAESRRQRLEGAGLRVEAARLMCDAGQAELAIAWARQSLAIMLPRHFAASPVVAEAFAVIGTAAARLGRADEAREAFDQSLQRWRLLDPSHARVDQIEDARRAIA